MEKFVVLYSFILLLDILLDWYNIEIRRRFVRHLFETAIVAIVYLGSTALLILLSTDSPCLRRDLFISTGIILFLWIAVRWILHDLLLNLCRGLPFDYLGRGELSANSDKILFKFKGKGVNQWVVKTFVLAAFLLLSFILLTIKSLLLC